jgi:hypothetical protein
VRSIFFPVSFRFLFAPDSPVPDKDFFHEKFEKTYCFNCAAAEIRALLKTNIILQAFFREQIWREYSSRRLPQTCLWEKKKMREGNKVPHVPAGKESPLCSCISVTRISLSLNGTFCPESGRRKKKESELKCAHVVLLLVRNGT